MKKKIKEEIIWQGNMLNWLAQNVTLKQEPNGEQSEQQELIGTRPPKRP